MKLDNIRKAFFDYETEWDATPDILILSMGCLSELKRNDSEAIAMKIQNQTKFFDRDIYLIPSEPDEIYFGWYQNKDISKGLELDYSDSEGELIAVPKIKSHFGVNTTDSGHRKIEFKDSQIQIRKDVLDYFSNRTQLLER